MNNTPIGKPCINAKTTDCKGLVTKRGNILCDTCIELRRISGTTRRENELEDILKKLKDLEAENARLNELVKNNSKIKELEETIKNNQLKFEEELKHTQEYGAEINKFLEKENSLLSDLVTKLRKDNENLIAEKSRYEMTHDQTKLDNDKIKIDNERLRTQVSTLMEQVEFMNTEIKNLTDIQQENNNTDTNTDNNTDNNTGKISSPQDLPVITPIIMAPTPPTPIEVKNKNKPTIISQPVTAQNTDRFNKPVDKPIVHKPITQAVTRSPKISPVKPKKSSMNNINIPVNKSSRASISSISQQGPSKNIITHISHAELRK